MSDITWRKASRSRNNNACVEVAFDDQRVLIRDSKYAGPAANQPILAIPAADWNSFLNLVAGGE